MISGNKNEERCITKRKKASEINKPGLTLKNSTRNIPEIMKYYERLKSEKIRKLKTKLMNELPMKKVA